MIRKIILGGFICLLHLMMLLVLSCSGSGEEPPVGDPPQLLSSDPAEGRTDVAEGISELTLRFDQNVTLAPSPRITLNGEQVSNLRPGLGGEM